MHIARIPWYNMFFAIFCRLTLCNLSIHLSLKDLWLQNINSSTEGWSWNHANEFSSYISRRLLGKVAKLEEIHKQCSWSRRNDLEQMALLSLFYLFKKIWVNLIVLYKYFHKQKISVLEMIFNLMENSIAKKLKPWKCKLEILHRCLAVQMAIQRDTFLKAVVDFQSFEFFQLNWDTYVEDVFLTVYCTQLSSGKCNGLWLQDIKLGNLMVPASFTLCDSVCSCYVVQRCINPSPQKMRQVWSIFP